VLLVEQFHDFAAALTDHHRVLQRGELIPHGRAADMERHGARACLAI